MLKTDQKSHSYWFAFCCTPVFSNRRNAVGMMRNAHPQKRPCRAPAPYKRNDQLQLGSCSPEASQRNPETVKMCIEHQEVCNVCSFVQRTSFERCLTLRCPGMTRTQSTGGTCSDCRAREEEEREREQREREEREREMEEQERMRDEMERERE